MVKSIEAYELYRKLSRRVKDDSRPKQVPGAIMEE
jgi:hypothetical protein